MSPEPLPPEKMWQGTAVSSGVAHAVAHVLKDHFDEPDERPIPADQVDAELERLKDAIDVTREEIIDLKRAVGESSPEADIFETHILILEDQSILSQVTKTVREELLRVDSVYYRLMCRHMNALRGLADPYLRERFLDIKDVTQRVMRHLRGEMLQRPMFEDPVIIVAHDLAPSDTVQLDRSKVLGFAMETGAANSHAAIIARSLGLPAVVRLHGICDHVHSGDSVLLDGGEGRLILNPGAETLARYRLETERDQVVKSAIDETRHQPAITLDGCSVRIGANAEFIDELDVIRDSGASEIGLFRTEFLHLADPHASEEWLANCYSQVVHAMAPGQVIFRTLDLGGDKVDGQEGQEAEPNPFLGWRGIRVSLGRQKLFKRQLRALIRAGVHGPIGIMFPMVSDVSEVRTAKNLLDECATELLREGVAVPDEIEVGAMIEIPGAALSADLIAAEVDFLSLGTNDLIQYTLAVDRLNERVADLYQPTHPAVLRLIALTVSAARQAGIRVAICGEMASDVALTPLLIGLGLDEFSVATGQVARLKHAVRRLHSAECECVAGEAQKLADATQIAELCRAVAMERYPELFE